MQKSVNRILLIILLTSVGVHCSAQQVTVKSDIDLIHAQLSMIDPDPFKRPYIYQHETSFIKKYNPISFLLGSSLYIYQNVFSKHISADCLFTPSCSEFSKQAIKEYGLLKGTLLSIERVNRCNRIAATDLSHSEVDPKTNRYSDPVSRHKYSLPEY
jgi:putative membrane protein insertion efficiency factor